MRFWKAKSCVEGELKEKVAEQKREEEAERLNFQRSLLRLGAAVRELGGAVDQSISETIETYGKEK